MSIEAMKQALETIVMGENRGATIHALRQAIEQAEKKEPVAYDGTATESGAHYQADQHLRALLRYTEYFYGVAIKHGMKAGEAANAIAHIEKAAKALHELVHAWSNVAKQRHTTPQPKQ